MSMNHHHINRNIYIFFTECFFINNKGNARLAFTDHQHQYDYHNNKRILAWTKPPPKLKNIGASSKSVSIRFEINDLCMILSDFSLKLMLGTSAQLEIQLISFSINKWWLLYNCDWRSCYFWSSEFLIK